MKHPIMNPLPVKSSLLLSLALSLWAVQRASAGNAFWVGTYGVSPDVNWSDAANFVTTYGGSTAATPYNNAAIFNFNTAVQAPGEVTVNVDGPNPVNGGGGVEPTAQAWDMSFNHTNGYHTVMIQPGITLTVQAYNGTPGQGLYIYPNTTTGNGTGGGQTVGSGPFTNNTVFTGAGASFVVNGGIRVEAGASSALNHYTIVDMSGLDNFSQISSSGAGARFQMVNGQTRSQALMYLAKTNLINNSSDVTIGYLGNSYSNSLPIGVYLGYSNAITTGGGANQLALAIQGCTNGFLKFNPNFLGGLSKPVVYISGNGAATNNGGFPTVSGMMAGALIARSDGAVVPSYGIADFTGGIVTWNVGQLQLGRAGNAGIGATGVLAFDSGTITANDIWCGWQQVTSGGAGVGTINVGANATLQVNNAIRLAVVTGVATSGSAGTLNVNGGTLAANIITNGGGVATMNLTNATWAVAITPGVVSPANAVVTTLNTGGATNLVSIGFASLPTSYPFTNRLVVYNSLGGVGAANMGVSFPMGGNYQGYVYNNAAANAIDLVVTNGAAPSAIAWSGADLSGNWDVAATVNWTNGAGAPVQYHQLDSVRFDDTASGTTSVNLVGGTPLTPSGLLVANTAKNYTFGGSGNLAGAGVTGGAIPGGLVKQGTGTLILANTTLDTYLGGVTISAGILQVGDGSTTGSGSLGPSSGAVANNGGLVINRPGGDTFAVANVISGAGGITNAGSGTLALNNANTFTGPVVVNAGTLQLGNNAALGTTAGGTIIQNGATLELNGFNPGAEPIIVQGVGAAGSSGAIVNDGSGTPVLTAVTLTNDATFGGSSRWDLQGTLNAGGHNLTLVYNAPTYSAEWRDLNAANVGNIDLTSGILGWVGSTTAGTTGTLTVESGAAIKFYNSSSTVNLTKPLVLNDGSTIANLGGANLISGPVTFNGYGSYGTIDVSASYPLTLSGPLSGSGTLYKTSAFTDAGAGQLSITGSSPSFSGTVSLYIGKIRLDGALGSGTSSTITTQNGTLLAGVGGVNNGSVDIQGGYTPGDAGVAGTNTFGSLTLEGTALMTNNLSSSVNGGNSRIIVNGALAMYPSTIYIHPISGTLQNGIYTLATYTGNLNSSLPAAQMDTLPSVYTVVLSNATTLSPKQIQAIVTGAATLLVWDNAGGNAEWDEMSGNWSNTVTHVANDVFFSSDSVAFNDSITNTSPSATSIDIGPGIAVSPSVLSNNSTVNYTFSGAGSIGGGASIIKLGSSTLTVSNANTFTGPVTISGGTLLAASATALGGTSSAVTVTNGGTLDIGFHLGAKPVVVVGAGVGGKGAIVNNNGAPVYDDSSGGLANTITLAGDATFGGSNRWDIGSPSGATLSTGSKSNNITYVGTGIVPGSYFEWNNVTVDPALANISIIGTELGVKGMTNLGNATNTVTIYTNSQLTFWGGTNYNKNYYVKNGGTMLVRRDGPVFNLTNTLEGGATFHSIDNFKVMNGPVTLLGVAQFVSDSATCIFSNVISGASGGFNFSGGSTNFAFAAANTYQGPTIISSGLTLALLGNGSILNSTPIHFSGTDTNGARLDVSGRTDSTLTLASLQTLEGSGKVNGALTVSANATVAPGTNSASPSFGAIGATGAVTLNGTTTMKIYHPSGNDVVQSGTSITYGGTLNLEFLTGTLVAGDSWKLFNAPAGNYFGSFTISPSSPATGLYWDTSQLAVSGTLRVIAPPTPDFTTVTFGGGNIILRGTNGQANATYVVVSSTNVAQSLSLWAPVHTNQFDGFGNFNWTNSINPAEPTRFYRIRYQPQ